MVHMHDMTRSTHVVPALGAEIEMPASTADQGSLVEDYQAADWKSALHTGNPRESETDRYTLDGKPCNAQSSVNSMVSHVPPSGSDHPQTITIDFCQDVSLDPEQVGQYQPTSREIVKGWRTCGVPVLLDTDACIE